MKTHVFLAIVVVLGALSGCSAQAVKFDDTPRAPAEAKPRVEDIAANDTIRKVFETQSPEVCREYAELYAAVAEAVQSDESLNRDLAIYLLERTRDSYPPNTLPNVPGFTDAVGVALEPWLDRNKPVPSTWRADLSADLMEMSAGMLAAAK